jgi:hypothetical protein
MDPLHLCIALGPLAAYLLLLGMLNLSRRPFLTTGARDTAALGLAIMGFVVAGPMELFLPEAAATRFGGVIWVLLLAFYLLCLTLVVLLMRPRVVIYNISADQLRPILAGVVTDLDADARWAGESLVLPRLGIQLYVEPFVAMRNIQLVSSGPRQSYQGWRQLEIALARAVREVRGQRNRYGFSLVFFGLVLVGLITFRVLGQSQDVAQALIEMLRL